VEPPVIALAKPVRVGETRFFPIWAKGVLAVGHPGPRREPLPPAKNLVSALQPLLTGREDVRVHVGRALARLAIGEMGPVAPLEGDLAEGFLLLEVVLPVEPGSISACLTGKYVTLDCDRSRRSHLRISGGHPHTHYSTT
jgi:hypothetical protein